jgi:hypothetical protein
MHAAAAAAAGASGAATEAGVIAVPETAMQLPEHLLEHRAVLLLPDGTPFSEVVESYTGNVLAFPLP